MLLNAIDGSPGGSVVVVCGAVVVVEETVVVVLGIVVVVGVLVVLVVAAKVVNGSTLVAGRMVVPVTVPGLQMMATGSVPIDVDRESEPSVIMPVGPVAVRLPDSAWASVTSPAVTGVH